MPFDIDMDWSLEPPGLVARFTPGPQHHGPADSLHGGIAALLLDECMAALGHSLDRIHTVTGTLNLKFRRPVPLDGRVVRVEAWRPPAGGGRAHSEPRRATKVFGQIVTADGDIAVEANGLFVRVPASAYPKKNA
jgi:acyl-coenzyme A thioesterase PaaI-like protein